MNWQKVHPEFMQCLGGDSPLSPSQKEEISLRVWQRIEKIPQPQQIIFRITLAAILILFLVCHLVSKKLAKALLDLFTFVPVLSEILRFHQKLGASLEAEMRTP